jgi:hypothetical protein
MAEFNQELVKALAHGDAEAHEQIKSLPLTVRMALGTAVDQLRRDENIVPMNSGFSIYEQKLLREADEKREAIRKEFLEKEIKAKVERARAGLTMNDRR